MFWICSGQFSHARLSHSTSPFLPPCLADLTPSNKTQFKGAVDFQKASPIGRYIRFGVRLVANCLSEWVPCVFPSLSCMFTSAIQRTLYPACATSHTSCSEHGMAAICNGITAFGGLIPYCGTFLNFIGYAQGAVRVSALSHFRVIYVGAFFASLLAAWMDDPTRSQRCAFLSY